MGCGCGGGNRSKNIAKAKAKLKAKKQTIGAKKLDALKPKVAEASAPTAPKTKLRTEVEADEAIAKVESQLEDTAKELTDRDRNLLVTRLQMLKRKKAILRNSGK